MGYAALLAGCYRRDDAADPEVFLSAIVAVLSTYPETAVRAVCDPRGGLPATSKFLPTVYEVREALEAKMRPIRDAERQRRIAVANAADRPAPVAPDEAERRRAFIHEWLKDADKILSGARG